jgi:hypothetical protein
MRPWQRRNYIIVAYELNASPQCTCFARSWAIAVSKVVPILITLYATCDMVATVEPLEDSCRRIRGGRYCTSGCVWPTTTNLPPTQLDWKPASTKVELTAELPARFVAELPQNFQQNLQDGSPQWNVVQRRLKSVTRTTIKRTANNPIEDVT